MVEGSRIRAGECHFRPRGAESAGGDGDARLGGRIFFEAEGDFTPGGLAAGIDEEVAVEEGGGRPTESAGDPSEEKEGGGAGTWGMANLDRVDGGKLLKGGMVVKERGEGEAAAQNAGPIQIAEDGLSGLGGLGGASLEEKLELLPRLSPLGTIEEEAIHPGPHFLFQEGREIRLPPEDEGEVGIEVGKDDIREGGGGFAGEVESDLFRADLTGAFADEVAMGTDPSLGGGRGFGGIAENEESAAGVFTGQFGDQLVICGESLRIFGIDGEIDERGAGFGIRIFFPEAAQLAFDVANFDRKPGGFEEGGVHYSLLQTAPCRARRASASLGPQVPAG